MERLPVRVIALFFFHIYLVVSKKMSTFAPDLVRGGSRKLWHEAARHAEKPVKQLIINNVRNCRNQRSAVQG